MNLDLEVTFNKDKTEATIKYGLEYVDKVLPIAQRLTVTKEDILKEFLNQHPNLTVTSIIGSSSIHNSHGPKRTDGVWTVTLLTSKNVKPTAKKTTKSYKTTKTGA